MEASPTEPFVAPTKPIPGWLRVLGLLAVVGLTWVGFNSENGLLYGLYLPMMIFISIWGCGHSASDAIESIAVGEESLTFTYHKDPIFNYFRARKPYTIVTADILSIEEKRSGLWILHRDENRMQSHFTLRSQLFDDETWTELHHRIASLKTQATTNPLSTITT